MLLLNDSKNDATGVGLSKVVLNLSYNSCIEEVNLSELGSVKGKHEGLSKAFAKLFQLTVSLSMVCHNYICSLVQNILA